MVRLAFYQSCRPHEELEGGTKTCSSVFEIVIDTRCPEHNGAGESCVGMILHYTKLSV